MNWSDLNCSNITVVGNGPLSSQDRAEIESSDCVLRFNDMKNKREEEKTDIHVIRFPSAGGIDKMSIPFIPVIEKESDRALFQKSTRPILSELQVFIENVKKNSIDPNLSVFPGCRKCDEKNACKHSSALLGPSTGALVISELEQDKSVSKIHVYGMNWNAGDWHIDFKDPTLVPECCTKCVIHPTHTNKYNDV